MPSTLAASPHLSSPTLPHGLSSLRPPSCPPASSFLPPAFLPPPTWHGPTATCLLLAASPPWPFWLHSPPLAAARIEVSSTSEPTTSGTRCKICTSTACTHSSSPSPSRTYSFGVQRMTEKNRVQAWADSHACLTKGNESKLGADDSHACPRALPTPRYLGACASDDHVAPCHRPRLWFSVSHGVPRWITCADMIAPRAHLAARTSRRHAIDVPSLLRDCIFGRRCVARGEVAGQSGLCRGRPRRPWPSALWLA